MTDGINKALIAINQAIQASKLRKNIEIECKYECNEATLTKLESWAVTYNQDYYTLIDKGSKPQEDIYYDVMLSDRKYLLCDHGCTFRIRKKSADESVFTLKLPTKSKNYQTPQLWARREYERPLFSTTIDDRLIRYIRKCMEVGSGFSVQELNGITCDTLVALITVKNTRRKFQIYSPEYSSSEALGEMCLDRVTYEATGKPSQLFQQIEIELLAPIQYWDLLQSFTVSMQSYFESIGETLIPATKSKLIFGLEKLDLITPRNE